MLLEYLDMNLPNTSGVSKHKWHASLAYDTLYIIFIKCKIVKSMGPTYIGASNSSWCLKPMWLYAFTKRCKNYLETQMEGRKQWYVVYFTSIKIQPSNHKLQINFPSRPGRSTWDEVGEYFTNSDQRFSKCVALKSDGWTCHCWYRSHKSCSPWGNEKFRREEKNVRSNSSRQILTMLNISF